MVPKINTATFCFRETLPAVTGTEKYASKSLLLKAVYSDEGLRELMVIRDNLKLPQQQNLETLANPKKALERYKKLRKLLPLQAQKQSAQAVAISSLLNSALKR